MAVNKVFREMVCEKHKDDLAAWSSYMLFQVTRKHIFFLRWPKETLVLKQLLPLFDLLFCFVLIKPFLSC